MEFFDFARAHGLMLNSLIPGKWVSVPTVDHPKKRNGRYKWLGDIGWVQNWATMERPEMWRGEGSKVNQFARRAIQNADQERIELARKAAQKAGWIMHQTKPETHEYLKRKGFEDEVGNVFHREDGERLLIVPMRRDGRLLGCQQIDSEGRKKFLYGQESKGASFVIDAKGINLFCEGYATALSIRAVMKAMKLRYTIHCCFSAGNMEYIASRVDGGIIIADNDPSGVGERAALKCNKPHWISPTVGEDFNDFHMRVGLFPASQSLKRVLFASASRT